MSKILCLSNDPKIFSMYKNPILVEKVLDIKFKSINKVSIIQNLPQSKKKVNSVYNYCEKKYENILMDLYKEFNKLHKLNYPKRYWEILIGRWLIDFIFICYKNYFTCKKALNKKNISYYISLPKNQFKLYTRNTIEANYAQYQTEWNFYLNSLIVKYLNPKLKSRLVNSKVKCYKMNNKILPKGSKNKFNYTKFLNYFKFLNKFNFSEDIFIYKTSLPFVQEKKLEILLNQIPKYWTEKKPVYKDFKSNIRKKINLTNSNCNDKFENFLRNIIPETLPIFIVEAFKDNLSISKSSGFPKKPKAIFTCYAYQADEIFKIYLAEKIIKQKTKYYCGQHGNNYFTAFQSRYAVELKTSDKFFSWGYKNLKKNIVPIFNFNCYRRSENKRLFNKNGNLLAICSKIGLNRSPIERNNLDLKSTESILIILNKFKNEVSKNILVRLSHSHKHEFKGYYFKKYYSNSGFKLNTDKNLRDLQINSRLNLFNYYSTGMLENFILNIPSICYLEKDFEYHNDFFQNKAKFLVDAKILFFDKEKLINHIKAVWKNIDKWWLNKETQRNIEKFNKNINLSGYNFNKLKRNILN